MLLLCGGVISILFTSKLFEFWSIFPTRYLNQYDARLEPLKMDGSKKHYSMFPTLCRPSLFECVINAAYSVEDFPERWSKPRPRVVMEVEESVHYGIESMASAYEWKELTPGNAPVRVGPNFNVAVLPLAHQLHCVEVFKDTLKRAPSLSDDWLHTQHCTNYLRQWAMCRADLTLERGDFAQRHFDWDRTGATHECHDWRGIYEGITADWNDWLSVWHKNDLNRLVPFLGHM